MRGIEFQRIIDGYLIVTVHTYFRTEDEKRLNQVIGK
jgi:hypothetical protein